MKYWSYTFAMDPVSERGKAYLDTLLSEGWEPFAATEDRDGTICVHLRRREGT